MTCEACRTIPPVISQGYEPKGEYKSIGGLNTYTTGPHTSTTAIIDIYDIFGISSQTIQGADLLAARLNTLVLVPDFFKGKGAQHDWIPMDTPEKEKALMGFFMEYAQFEPNVGVLKAAVEEFKAAFPTVGKWGVFGLCWGGKVTALSSGEGTPFVASGQVHPGRMDKADAEKITIPHIVLASKDEPADVVQQYKDIIANGPGSHVETYESMWHGWMGARADLDGEESVKEYRRGYEQLASFFEQHFK
ncbi:dienelactone hydrolase [Aspergillus steynii IBT 23096]|uniref:Dienelactone hydrolase n=1 Tax=Aspergillus steynii IBT 23096 TaxID=1392250 RepID=A0A2I2FYX0_9EURO|nr:dienelactone hydrolase [Aspergillus steynii IBT 23096]PLB45832.1 dienelactone hydrolase [Aspergillus steynii IBT 23096]